MGTNYSYRLMINTNDESVISNICAIVKTYEALGIIGKYMDCGKWDISKMISEITAKHPCVMLRVDTIIENNCHYTDFYLGNKNVNSHFIDPYFPSVSKFKSGVKKYNIYTASQIKKKEQEKALLKAAKEEETKEKEIKLLKELRERYPEA